MYEYKMSWTKSSLADRVLQKKKLSGQWIDPWSWPHPRPIDDSPLDYTETAGKQIIYRLHISLLCKYIRVYVWICLCSYTKYFTTSCCLPSGGNNARLSRVSAGSEEECNRRHRWIILPGQYQKEGELSPNQYREGAWDRLEEQNSHAPSPHRVAGC